jgi:hypothetical protein
MANSADRRITGDRYGASAAAASTRGHKASPDIALTVKLHLICDFRLITEKGRKRT